ncbi:MAG: class I SAM-dependent methyltransferase [Planctomycetes bacterium]|nr:class I SAM-dependent methyltransferase [Planctomycetota bacterium]
MSWQAIDWYDTPRYYDLIFDADTGVEADFLEAAAERYGKRGRRRVLEPACGSGRHVVELARRGWSVTGYDLSQPMLDYARERLDAAGLDARLALGALESYAPPGRYELAHCLVSTFKYVMDEAGARAHLEHVARALVPGGVYLLGFHLSDYDRAKRARERWTAREGRTEVVCNIQSWPPERGTRRERVRSRLAVREGRRELRSETEWWFRTYDARQARRLFASVPALELVAVHDFTYDLDYVRELDDTQEDCMFVLRKR